MNRSANARGPFREDPRRWREERPQYVVTPVQPDDDPFGWGVVRDYLGFVLRAPRRHLVLASVTFAVVFLVIAAAGRVMPVRWQVQATVLTQRNPLMISLANPGMGPREWDLPTRAARELVIRRENLVALTKQTDFVDKYLASRAPVVRARDWVFQKLTGKERTREELEEGLVDTLTDRLWVTTGAEGTVNFTFVWSDKEIAYGIVQAALQSFLDERYAEEIKVVKETIAILQEHDQEVQKQVSEVVDQVEQKERDLRIRTTPRPRPIVAAPTNSDAPELARLQSQLETRRRAVASMEDFRRTRLAELQAQLAQQRGIYAEDHPALQGTQQAIDTLSQASPQLVAMRAELAEMEKDVARRGGASSAAALGAAGAVDPYADARMRLFATEDPRLEVERRRMDDLMHQHSTLLQRIDTARVEMDTAQAAFKYRYNVIQPPQLPRKPMKPLVLMFLVAGLFAGVTMAFLASAVADLRTGRVVERWQVERALDLPVLGEIHR